MIAVSVGPATVAKLAKTFPRPVSISAGGGFSARFERRASMRLQSFIDGAMLVLLFGLGVWVALQYVPMRLRYVV